MAIWGTTLIEPIVIARRSQSNNSFGAWKQVTPLHNELVDRIIGATMHVLVSLRAKTEWVLERDEKTGKTVPRKVGLAPVMRDGIEYEFDVCGEMDQENTLTVGKTLPANSAYARASYQLTPATGYFSRPFG
jgi:hypothetical protein